MEGPWDHEPHPGSRLPLWAIFVAVVDRTACLLKSFVWQGKWWRTIKNTKRVSVLCKMPCCLLPSLGSLGNLAALGPAVVSPGGSEACSQLLQFWACLRVASVGPATKGGVHLGPRVTAASRAFCLIPALQMDPDFSSASLAYQGYIHHPAYLFNPIRAVFNWG